MWRVKMMDVLCALVLCASVRLAAGMAPLMGSFVPVGRLQGPEEVRMLLQSAAETRGIGSGPPPAKTFPMTSHAPAAEDMYGGQGRKELTRRPMARMPKMMKYSESSGINSNAAGPVYYKPYHGNSKPMSKPLRDFAMPGKTSSGGGMRDHAFEDNLYYTSQRAPPAAMTTMYPMTTTMPQMMYPMTTARPMSVAVMPKSMPATRPYSMMTSPPAPRHESTNNIHLQLNNQRNPPRDESMYYNVNDQQQHNFNRYERGIHRTKVGRNGMKRSKTGKRRRVRKKVYQEQERQPSARPKNIREVIESMETNNDDDVKLPWPPTATPAPLPSAGVAVTRNLVGKGKVPSRSGETAGTEMEKKSEGDRKKSYFEFKVPRVTEATSGGGKKDFDVQTIEVDGPLEYDFGRVLGLINSGFFDDEDSGGESESGSGIRNPNSGATSRRFTSKFPVVLPPSTL